MRIEETRSNTSFFYHAIPGEETIQISFLGVVRRPGIYVIGANTRLDELLALAGGPPETVSPQIERKFSIQVLRPNADTRTSIYSSPLDEMLEQPGRYPDLQEGDLVMLDARVRRKFGWRDSFRVITGISSVIILYTRVALLFD